MEKEYIIRRDGSVGDVILLTAVVKPLHEQGFRIYVWTGYPYAFHNNPHIVNVFTHIPERLKLLPIVDLNLSYENNPTLSIVESYVAIINDQCGTDIDHEQLRIALYPGFVDKVYSGLVQRRLSRRRQLLFIHAAVTSQDKNLPHELYQIITTQMLERDYQVINIGTRKDYALKGAFDLRNLLTVQQIYQLLLNNPQAIFLGVDSAVLHIVQAVGLRGIALFTSSDPALRLLNSALPIQPISSDVPCRYCRNVKNAQGTFAQCSTFECVNHFDPSEIVELLMRIGQ